jgi:hypothetical protein
MTRKPIAIATETAQEKGSGGPPLTPPGRRSRVSWTKHSRWEASLL